MTVKIEAEGCIGCGLCTQICDSVFQMNPATEVAEVYSQPSSNEEESMVLEAVENCPVSVISTEE